MLLAAEVHQVEVVPEFFVHRQRLDDAPAGIPFLDAFADDAGVLLGAGHVAGHSSAPCFGSGAPWGL